MSESSVTTTSPTVEEPTRLSINPPEKPNQCRAIGLVKGQFIPQEGNWKKGILVTPDQPFPARIVSYLRRLPSSEVIWRVWVKTRSDESGLSFELKSYITNSDKTPVDPSYLEQDYFSIRGQLFFWRLAEEEADKQFAISIRPNNNQYSTFKPFFLVIYSELPQPPRKKSFWDVTVTREGKKLVLLEGKEVFPPKKEQYRLKTVTETVSTEELRTQIVEAIGKDISKSTIAGWLSKGKLQERLASYCGETPFEVEFAEKLGNKNFYHLKRTVKVKKKRKKKPLPQSDKQQSDATSEQLPSKAVQQEVTSSATVPSQSKSTATPSATIMVQGRIPEITVKFNEPIELPAEGKKIAIEVLGQNQIKVRATLNRKTLKKQVTKMEQFEDWVGALSGKIAQVLPDGVIELEGAGIQVFEKKKKEELSENEQAVVSSESTKS